jgi:tetratricopeptide (TPR) repeat protein
MQLGSPEQEAIAAFQRGDLDRARGLAEQQLDREPSAPLLHLMGLIECRGGRLESGIAWLRRALQANPDDLASRVMLARALVDSGRPQEALEVASKPAGYTPPELALWHARAEAADAAQEWEQSAEAWGVMCIAHPNEWPSWCNRGLALTELRRWPEAIEALSRGVELNPAQLPLRRALATALSRAGRFHDAADELGRWVEASPDDVENRILFARLLADLGRQDESDAQLDKAARIAGAPGFEETADTLLAIAKKPPNHELDITMLRELAQLLERSNRTEALQVLLAAAEHEGVEREQLGYAAAAAAFREGHTEEARRILLMSPPEPLGRWHTLMSRIADALGDADTAFAEADAANRAQQDFEDWRERGQRHLEFIGALGDAITPQWAARLQALPPDGRTPPAFLVGFPRSGTTLLDTFLLGHPDTLVLEEIPVVSAVESALGDMRELPERSPIELARARDAYNAKLARHVQSGFSGLVIDKMPLNMLAAPYLFSVFPDAPFIFAQRHPCDAVLGCFMQSFAPNAGMACFLDIHTAAEFYDAAMRLWTRSREALNLKVQTVVYEQLVADPEPELRPVIDFLGLEWRDELLDHRATAKARSGIRTPSYNQITQPLTRAASGRWKRHAKHLEPVLPILLPWAERLGYSD